MKPVLGVSVYPDMDTMDDIFTYLKRASSHGFTRVFSSLFSVEGDDDEVLALFTDLSKAAHETGMELSLDVNPACLERFGAGAEDLAVFDRIGCDIVRMDMSFDTAGNLLLLKNPYGLKIEFNASSMSAAQIEELLKAGVDRERMLFCHNFYPQPYTGMKWHKFLAVNAELAKAKVRVGAFISSRAEGSHGVWNATYGLPTVERLRRLPVDLQVRMLMASGNVTDILFGNAFASEEEFAAIDEVLRKPDIDHNSPAAGILMKAGKTESPRITKIKVAVDPTATETETGILLDFFPHADAGDASEWIWRSRLPRIYYKEADIPQRVCDKQLFERGDVLIMNDVYGHYKGEIQVCLMPMENDGQRNLIGHIDPEEQQLLDLLRDHDIVIFEKA